MFWFKGQKKINLKFLFKNIVKIATFFQFKNFFDNCYHGFKVFNYYIVILVWLNFQIHWMNFNCSRMNFILEQTKVIDYYAIKIYSESNRSESMLRNTLNLMVHSSK